MNIQSYAELGWSFFPVQGPHYAAEYSDSKKPFRGFSWKPFQSRKPTSQEITQWQQNTPKMSIGVPTGLINNFIVVDIDSNDWMLQFPNADFGITWKSKSTRGCHFFYQWEDWMLDITSTGSAIGDIKGFDIRGQGGYVVVPNDNDPARSWEIHPADQGLAKMPDWIKTFLTTALSKNKPKQPVEISAIAEGNRHDSFLRLTGKLHRAGWAPSEIFQVLEPLAKQSGFDEEVKTLITDVVTRYPIDRREKLRGESMEALLSEPEPPLKWLIEGLWVDQAKGFIAGHPGVGKTWIALDMILSVATGGLCLGRYKPAYQAPCLIVEEEASRRNLQRRIHALARARNLKPGDLSSVFHMTQQFASLPQDGVQITDFVQAHQIKLVVFDSLRAVHSAKENSSDEMAQVLKSFAEISIVGQCSVILIHHLAKSNAENAAKNIFERMRGTGSLWAWRDCVLGIEGEEESESCTCTFQFRDTDSPDPIQIKRHVSKLTAAIGLQASQLEETEEFFEKSQEVVAFVRSKLEGVSRNEICKVLEGSKQHKLALIKRMVKQSLLEKSGSKLVVSTNAIPGNTTGTV